MKHALWLFILLVAVLDVAFTWHAAAYIRHCELNPVTGAIIQSWGVAAALVYRGAFLAFAFVMSKTRTRFSKYVLPVWTIGHCLCLLLLLGAMYELGHVKR